MSAGVDVLLGAPLAVAPQSLPQPQKGKSDGSPFGEFLSQLGSESTPLVTPPTETTEGISEEGDGQLLQGLSPEAMANLMALVNALQIEGATPAVPVPETEEQTDTSETEAVSDKESVPVNAPAATNSRTDALIDALIAMGVSKKGAVRASTDVMSADTGKGDAVSQAAPLQNTSLAGDSDAVDAADLEVSETDDSQLLADGAKLAETGNKPQVRVVADTADKEPAPAAAQAVNTNEAKAVAAEIPQTAPETDESAATSPRAPSAQTPQTQSAAAGAQASADMLKAAVRDFYNMEPRRPKDENDEEWEKEESKRKMISRASGARVVDVDAQVEKINPVLSRNAEKSDSQGQTADTHKGSMGADILGAFSQALDNSSRGAAPVSVQPPVMLASRGEEAFTEAMTHVLRVVSGSEGTRAVVTVDPPALGRVDVSLNITANGVEALFRVDNEAVRQMLHVQMDNLKSALQAQGMQVTAMEVDLRSRDDKNNQNQNQSGKLKRLGRLGETADTESDEVVEARIDLQDGMLHWVA